MIRGVTGILIVMIIIGVFDELSHFRGGEIAYLIDPDRYAG